MSASSTASIVIAKARANAEAAQARAAYAKREIDIKVEKACLEATVDAVQEEKEKDAALAEAEILEVALHEVDLGLAGRFSPPVPGQKRLQRTLDNVIDHAGLSLSQQFNRVRDEEPRDSADTVTLGKCTVPPTKHPQTNNLHQVIRPSPARVRPTTRGMERYKKKVTSSFLLVPMGTPAEPLLKVTMA